jgi:transposase
MAQKLQVDWQEDEATLYELYKQEKDHQIRPRLHALWLLHQGHAMKQVATLLGVHYRTIQEWVAWYRQGGIAEVRRHRHGGNHGGTKPRLTAEQEAELKAEASAGRIRTIQDGVEWARETHQVVYTYWGMRWVFYRLGLRKKAPRPRSPKAPAELQEAWKRGDLPLDCKKSAAGTPPVYTGVTKCA